MAAPLTVPVIFAVLEISTLPVEIYSAIRKGFTPEINAISSIVFFISAASILIVGRELRF